MKECGNLKVITDSINEYLLDIFDKDLTDLLISDLLLVEALTIDGNDIDNNKKKVSFQDLKNFKNLRYLEIANTLVGNSDIDKLSNLVYLENVIFRNCDFNTNINNMNKLTNISCIRIINCTNFSISYINKLKNIKRVYLEKIILNDLKKFSSFNLESLDISGCSLKNVTGLDKLKVKYLVISNVQFNKFQEKILNSNIKIMVIADPSIGYYIDKWIN